jgi:stage II sporulation protein D
VPRASASPPGRLSTARPVAPTKSALTLPDNLEREEDGEPLLRVYVVEEGAIRDMPMEEYLLGVVAGEMKNDWPIEALKAQAIIARTFALKFIEDKGGSMYEGADLSTDVQECQAYLPQDINDRVRDAIEETRGEVITYEGELTYAWFHAHAGGQTAQAKEGLEWEGEEPPYIKSVPSTESPDAPEENRAWEAAFSLDQVKQALDDMGFSFGEIQSVSLGERGPSGRATTLEINGTPVTAPSLRVRLSAAEFKSTLLSFAGIENGQFVVLGKGYGHGVGMSQWGAYHMAKEGQSAEDIVMAYYQDVAIEKAW